MAEPTAALARRLRRDMASHLVPIASSGDADTADVAVVPWDHDTRPEVRGALGGTVFQLAEIHGRGDPGIGTLDRGRLTAGILQGREVRVVYDSSRASVGRVYGLLLTALRLALYERGASLLHAACLGDGKRSFLLVGPRGAGKTRLVLGLLNRGWSYLADDKVVLTNGAALPFEPWIGIRDWHLDALPWLPGRLPRAARSGRTPHRRALRRHLRAWGERRLPKRLAGPWRQRFNRVVNVPVAEMFPHAPQPASARIDAIVHLRSGRVPRAGELNRREAIRRVSLLQRIASQDWYPLPDLLAIAVGHPIASHEPELLAGEFAPDVAGAEIEVAEDADVEAMESLLALTPPALDNGGGGREAAPP